VTYIHHNPQTHGLIADFRDWPHQPTHLRRDEVLAWFGSPAQVAAAHRLDATQRRTPLSLEDFEG
jgi:hypothetical protein